MLAPLCLQLYFLAFSDDVPPKWPDVTALDNREWLWGQRFVQVELQHWWESEMQPMVPPPSADVGFVGLTLAVNDPIALAKRLGRGASSPAASAFGAEGDGLWGSGEKIVVTSPDGVPIRLVSRQHAVTK